MTVETSISKSGPYAGAGTTGPFTVNFRFLDQTHLRVIRTDNTGEHVLTLTTDYTVAGVGNPTGSVTLVVALPVGQTLTIIRNVPKTQEADYVQNDDFPAESHENALDKLTMITQQINEVVDRTVTFPASDSASATAELPIASIRANNLLGFDALGKPVAIVPSAQSAAALQALLATDVGASMIGREGTNLDQILKNSTPLVVDTVDAIRNIDSTKHRRALALSYYSGVAGGGDDFYADPTDLAGVDDGGVLLVAVDGMRWKRAPKGIISALAFGCVGNDSFDNNVRGQAYVTWALNNSAPMYWPAGKYRSSSAWTGTGKPAHVFGDSVETTQIIFTNAASGGFNFTMNPQTGSVPPQQCTVRQMTIETRAAIGTPGFAATWSSRVPNAFGQFWAEDVNIVRNNAGTSSFSEGIRLRNCVGGWLDRVNILGDDARVGNYGLRLESCIEIMCDKLRVNRYKEAVHINKLVGGDPQTEGIFINNSFLFDCNRGLYSPDAAIHINLLGTFINPNGASASAGVELVSCSQYTINNCLIYTGGNPGDAANQDGVRLTACGGGKVTENQFAGVTKANARYGVVTSGSTSYADISDNEFSFFSGSGVNVSAAGDTGNRVTRNNFYDCTDTVLNSGTGTVRERNTVTAALGTPLPLNSLRFGSNTGANTFAQGNIASDSNWGMFLYPYNGAGADIALADSGGTVVAGTETGRFMVRSYAKASLPSAATSASMYGLIIVTDDVGGLTLAFSDGAAWRRVADRAIIS